MKPNFTAGAAMNALQNENAALRRALGESKTLTGLIEACASGFCASMPNEKSTVIALKVLEVVGAIATLLETPEHEMAVKAESRAEVLDAQAQPIAVQDIG